MEETKKKLHFKDVEVIKGVPPKKYYKADGVDWSLDEDYVRRQACTHLDCKLCGEETISHYTMTCESCRSKKELAAYNAFPLVEWNGTDGLSLYNDPETYFFDIDDVEQYCEDNEIEKKDLQLVLCEPTRFNEINVCEFQEEVIHEDWEPDAKLLELEAALNEYLRTASTRTWLPTDQRVSIVCREKLAR
jgi:hypothetical protein